MIDLERDRIPVRDGTAKTARDEGCGIEDKGLLDGYKLLDMGQAPWRRLDGAHLLALVSAGIPIVDGVQHANQGRRQRARAA